MKATKIIYAFIIAAIAAIGCDKLETYSEIPEVNFQQVYIADTLDALGNDIKLQNITIQVIDGDGNLGLNTEDTTGNFAPNSQYYNNLFITISRKLDDGSYKQLDNLTGNYRIPYKAPIGQNKYLKAEIKIKMEIALGYIDYDTIRYEIQVCDRLLNSSEKAISCDIPIRRHGTVWADGHTSFFADEETEEESSENSETTEKTE
jgi:hypothetical protein